MSVEAGAPRALPPGRPTPVALAGDSQPAEPSSAPAVDERDKADEGPAAQPTASAPTARRENPFKPANPPIASPVTPQAASATDTRPSSASSRDGSADASGSPARLVGSITDAWAELLSAAQSRPSWRWMKALNLVNSDDLLAQFIPGQVNSEQVRFLLSQRSKLAEELSRLTGRSIRVEIQVSDRQQPSAESQAGNQPLAIQDAMKLPLVRKVMDQFNATVLSVRRDAASAPIRPAAGPDSENSGVTDPADAANLSDDDMLAGEPDSDSL